MSGYDMAMSARSAARVQIQASDQLPCANQSLHRSKHHAELHQMEFAPRIQTVLGLPRLMLSFETM